MEPLGGHQHHPDGRRLYPPSGSAYHRDLAPDDVAALIANLRARPPQP